MTIFQSRKLTGNTASDHCHFITSLWLAKINTFERTFFSILEQILYGASTVVRAFYLALFVCLRIHITETHRIVQNWFIRFNYIERKQEYTLSALPQRASQIHSMYYCLEIFTLSLILATRKLKKKKKSYYIKASLFILFFILKIFQLSEVLKLLFDP